MAAEPESDIAAAPAEASLEEIDRQLNNPLTSLWSLIFQNNLSLLEGDDLEDTEVGNTFFFQPALPVPVGDGLLWLARPVFPIVTSPVFSEDGGGDGSNESGTAHTTGFGDIQVFSVLGPATSVGSVWGVGGTFKFPTASADVLGSGKWQAGPAALYFYMGRPWTLGTLVQHWWSVGGDENRGDVNRTDIQYVARHSFPGAWSLGLGPTISIDWNADPGNRLTFPIGLGITKTVRLGGTPVKIRFEPQYSIIRPDDLGTSWNIRIQIAPVIASPFGG